MQHNEYGYVCSTETKIFSDLDKWLADKKKRERHDKSKKEQHAINENYNYKERYL